jgi:hypothetical protein
MPPRTRTRQNSLHALATYWTDPGHAGDLLTGDERDFVVIAVREYRRRLRNVDPSVVMRIEGVLTLYVLARRAGLAALRSGLLQQTGENSGKGRRSGDGDDVGRTQEQLRKALKDLDESLGTDGAACAAGLADLVRPLLKETEGVAETAIETSPGRGASSGNGARIGRCGTAAAVVAAPTT